MTIGRYLGAVESEDECEPFWGENAEDGSEAKRAEC